MRPMSWYSGSHETPISDEPAGSGMSALSAAHWAISARCVRATGLGSTVEPLENWMSPSPSGSTGRSASLLLPESSATVAQPSGGGVASSAGPRSRFSRRSVSTSEAPLTDSMRLVERAYSASLASRTGG